MQAQVEKISAHAGSLIVWMGEEPHCNYPNDSDRFRINQYVKMFPAQTGRPNTATRRLVVSEMTSHLEEELTPLGLKLLGINSW